MSSSCPCQNTADAGIVAVFLFVYVGDEIYMLYVWGCRIDTLLFAAAHSAFTSAAAVWMCVVVKSLFAFVKEQRNKRTFLHCVVDNADGAEAEKKQIQQE